MAEATKRLVQSDGASDPHQAVGQLGLQPADGQAPITDVASGATVDEVGAKVNELLAALRAVGIVE